MRFYPAPLDPSEVNEWIARNMQRDAKAGHGLWAMILNQTNEFIGDCSLTVMTVDAKDETEIGYQVRRDH